MGAKYILSEDNFALAIDTAYRPLRINAGAARKVILREWGITDMLAGATDEGIGVQIMTGETDTTGTTTTPKPLGNASAAAASGELIACAASATPVEHSVYAVPAGAALVKRYDDDEGIVIAASTGIYFQLTAHEARAAGNVTIWVIFEEV